MSLPRENTMPALSPLPQQNSPQPRTSGRLRAQPVAVSDPRRAETEAFIQAVFQNRYGAQVPRFAPQLLRLEQDSRIVAAAGWRGAGDEALYLERYLDAPVEAHIRHLAGQEVTRMHIAEVGNLATVRSGAGVRMVFFLAQQLHRNGFDWVVFTATSELIGILTRMGMPPLALQLADPDRLGDEALAWGRYYETRPVVVAGRIRQALSRATCEEES
jgi:hypothetical protein